MTHTPGPWRVSKEKRRTLVCDENGNQIALIRPVKRYGIAGDDSSNAALIASAPALQESRAELLDAARSVTLAALEPSETYNPRAYRAALDVLIHAIAKADAA